MAKQVLLVARFMDGTVNDDAALSVVDSPAMVVRYAEALLSRIPPNHEPCEIGLMRVLNCVPVNFSPLMKWDGEQWHVSKPDGSWIAAKIASKFNGTGPVIEPATDFGGES